MPNKPLKIAFTLDGTGLYYDPREPLHLDALLAWSLAPYHCGGGEAPSRDEEPIDIPLPLESWHIGGAWGWKASALFPDGDQAESLQFWRKKFRQSRAELSSGTPNLQNGTYREWNMPLPLLLVPRMIAWAVGDRKRVDQILRRHVKYLGKKRAYGKGRVTGICVEWCEEDHALSLAGRATRWLPAPNGTRLVRPRPPYWNNLDRVKCCEIGDAL